MITVNTVVTGIRSFSDAARRMDGGVHVNVRGAIQETTEAVAGHARQNVKVSGPEDRKAKNRPGPGELRDSIRTAYAIDGLRGFVLVGYGKLPRRSRAKTAGGQARRRKPLRGLRDLGVYAMVNNYGSPGRGIPATHFMDRAREVERQPHVSRISRALAAAATATNGAAS